MVYNNYTDQLRIATCTLLFYDVLQYSGIFELVPSGEVYVCTGQSQLEVVCSSSASDFLEWNLTFPALNNFPYIRILSKTTVAKSVRPIRVESVEFMVTVTQNPLTSRASANQISPVLNGSMILCREQYQNAEIRGNSAEVVIHVVNSTTAGLFNGVQPCIIVSKYFPIQPPPPP